MGLIMDKCHLCGSKLSTSNSDFYDETKAWFFKNLDDLDMIIRKNQNHQDSTFKLELGLQITQKIRNFLSI